MTKIIRSKINIGEKSTVKTAMLSFTYGTYLSQGEHLWRQHQESMEEMLKDSRIVTHFQPRVCDGLDTCGGEDADDGDATFPSSPSYSPYNSLLPLPLSFPLLLSTHFFFFYRFFFSLFFF